MGDGRSVIQRKSVYWLWKGVQDDCQELLQLVAGTQPHSPQWEQKSFPLVAEDVAEYKRGGVL